MAGRTRDEKKERAITAAALELFAQNGYAATSVAQIARTAGVGKGSVYTYFSTKADIFVAAITRWFARYHTAIAGLMGDIKDPIRRLRRIVEICTELFDPKNPETVRVAFEILKQAVTAGGVFYERRHQLNEISAEMRRIVQATLLEGVAAGVFRPEIARDVETIAINLLAYLDGIFLHAMVSDRYFDLKTQIDFQVRILMNHLVASQEKIVL